ncbi:MAG TPA: acyl-CoA dehydrogenase family protein [Solirubrobacteraceae bacterium]|jgi:alkylation response protein AidB-like acyl-CoA dehydrogenase|nr:acyl-CoA dehydrogenase family protein [Solirubrobacteraceae bacterium]
MNLALSDEQVLLREAARGALSRFKTLEDAREALDSGGEVPDLWPTAKEAGWPGLLIDEAHGGAGLDVFDAMLVLSECGRVLAAIPLLGHLPATAILDDSPTAGGPLLGALASGERRAAYLPARPGDDLSAQWTADPAHGMERAPLPNAVRDGDGARVSGQFAFVPDAPGADVLVGVALLAETGMLVERGMLAGGECLPASVTGECLPASVDGKPVGFAVESSAAGVSVEAVRRYDATRLLGHVTLKDAPATLLDAPEESLAAAWHLGQALIAAESLGAVETALETSVAYAKERYTFGRAIGSYQAVKHSLTEVLRQLENGRSLLYYAGWSRHGAPAEFPLAASAARSVAGRALDHAARTMISVHGGIGATWEHDAPLYFRRAQLSRRLLGGTALATDKVAGELITQA